ncbi:hypothetical protein BD310DRAFT_371415 [Dichomitus squalens]|uniref:Uncharacterized protein n=1 Tax=Dichomitus squalens TaxID=114155 RepID=A0A4Q9PYC5_9APHY|nr:hypothetical protein BD310DRAFT_371415 [Dichomitus squalens]
MFPGCPREWRLSCFPKSRKRVCVFRNGKLYGNMRKLLGLPCSPPASVNFPMPGHLEPLACIQETTRKYVVLRSLQAPREHSRNINPPVLFSLCFHITETGALPVVSASASGVTDAAFNYESMIQRAWIQPHRTDMKNVHDNSGALAWATWRKAVLLLLRPVASLLWTLTSLNDMMRMCLGLKDVSYWQPCYGP